ncbi:MAG: AAA family ATPase [Leuconostoc mesenteroides]|jgi:predicted ATPase
MRREMRTVVKEINVKHFRGLNEIKINFADNLTLIAGKNGTSKSTILGIIAQIFSFRTNYLNHQSLQMYTQLDGNLFESKLNDHFKLSEKFDLPQSMNIEIEVVDGLEKKLKSGMTLTLNDSSDRAKPRPILRNNPGADGKLNSRNITAPLIFLGLNRLSPISKRSGYKEFDDPYLSDPENQRIAKHFAQNVLAKAQPYTSMTPTNDRSGRNESIAPHGKDYDENSISVGEDNIGQIIKAILSFKRLKETYHDYSGGILLIDELDAGLFPAAQTNLIDELRKYSSKYKIQIIATTHSSVMLQNIFEEVHKNSKTNNKSIFLSDSYGTISKIESPSWEEIQADLTLSPISPQKTGNRIKIPIFLEDGEATAFFKALIYRRLNTNFFKIQTPLGIGADSFITLHNKKIDYFTKQSVVILDCDKDTKKISNFVSLPGMFPPDQLIFNFLFNIKDNDPFWEQSHLKESLFSPNTLHNIKAYRNIITEFNLNPGDDLKEKLSEYVDSNNNGSVRGQIRNLFKNFYKDPDIQTFFLDKKKPSQNIFYTILDTQKDWKSQFFTDFEKSLFFVYEHGYNMSKEQAKNVVNEIFKR